MLKGKSAIITGGVRGIGKAIAGEFARNGANLTLCYKNDELAAGSTSSFLKSFGAGVCLLKGDVADPEFAKEVCQKTAEAFGRIDILVNNAGITRDKLLIRMTDDDFKSVIETNLTGAFYMLREASRVMIKEKSGRIINMSSLVGIRGNPGQINYCASKAGIIGLTLSAAKELGRRGITVNAIAPGFIDTDMTGVLAEEQRTEMLKAVSLGRMGTPEDVAGAALFLASDLASYITGQVITVDGGMSI